MPHKCSHHDESALGLRAVPAGRKVVIAFTLDDDAEDVLIDAVTYSDADWVMCSKVQRCQR